MTRAGVKEYIEADQGCYLKAGRKEKRQVLDVLIRLRGYQHSKRIKAPIGSPIIRGQFAPKLSS